MTDGAYDEPVGVGSDESVDGFSGKLALEVAFPTLERPRRGHLLCQILQDVKRVPVQSISDIGEVVNYGPSPNHRYGCDGKLEPLPRRPRLRNACQCSVKQLIIVIRFEDPTLQCPPS